ncbi:MAG: cytidine deaminase [Bdellovibrionales bacterium]|nr:cytidine deaminase [Bdellovibrionales bacterium]
MIRSDLSQEENSLIEHAERARKNSYSPYSQFPVGAALLLDDGSIYTGTNVENASYGASLCAERIAVFKAITDGLRKIRLVAIIADTKDPCSPCGLCRQVINEFSDENTEVILANFSAQIKKYKLTELLPESFGPKDLMG